MTAAVCFRPSPATIPFVRFGIVASILSSLAMAATRPLQAADLAPAKSAPPARVDHPVKEADLATITLSPEAEQRLGLATATVERRKLARTRLLGGEVILPARLGGNGTNVDPSAFAALTSLAPADLMRVAQSQIDADGQVEQARVQLEAARIAVNRAEQLMRDKAGLARTVDEARTQRGLAEAALRTAQARRDILGPPLLAAATQPVLWLRVPVYVGDLTRLDPVAEARVGGLTDGPDRPTIPAQPVSAPPSANAAAATVDWFYALTNIGGTLRLGQRVGVNIPWQSDADSLIVPWSAIVHDVQGGAWLYQKTGALRYTRRRVQVRQIVGEQAALASGVDVGDSVVTTGVAELFGVEFGAGK